jgi:hypothetical protein
MNRTLFLSWQDPISRKWYPIGRLTSNGTTFTFAYTGGAEEAAFAGFQPLAAFPDLRTAYESPDLFPLFSNRVLSRSRPEYQGLLEWLSVPQGEGDPVAILARSGGQRRTDSFEVFPCPERSEDGEYQFHFLVHGLSHMTPEAITRAERLVPGERLLVMRDIQNVQDPLAMALRTSESFEGDMHLVGYCPRYLRGDIASLLDETVTSPKVTVERVNPPPVPVQFRILCKVKMKWPEGFQPFSGTEYQPLVSQHRNEGGTELNAAPLLVGENNPRRSLG